MLHGISRGRTLARITLSSLVLLVLLALSPLVAPFARAQTSTQSSKPTGAIDGHVVLEGAPREGSAEPSTPAGTITVTLTELRRRTTAAPDGTFHFDGVRAGEYLALAESELGGSGVARVRVEPGATAEAEIVLELTTIRDEVVVTATASPRSRLEIAQPTTVLSGEDLALRSDTTIGGTLDDEPGVSSTYFGPGASRPVIRGMGGDRIRVLEDGIGSADASSASPDHAVSTGTATAERIEVIRGPATLLYGSSAVGGVVNVLSGTIPHYVPEEAVSGDLHTTLGSVSDERSGALDLDGALGNRFAWHADYSALETDDYAIPGYADVEPLPGEKRGVLENSAQETENGAFGLSWIGDAGYLGASVTGFDTLYGVPGHEPGEEAPAAGEEGEEGVRIDLRQRRVDLRGELLRATGPFQGLKVRLGKADYEHVELEGSEIGTQFLNDTWEGRLDLVQRDVGRFSGTVGLQASTSDFQAIGEEAFVPPSTTDLLALFAYEEITFEPFRLQVGGRWETQDVSPEGTDAEGEALDGRSFDAYSGSLGGLWSLTGRDSLALTLSRSERVPTVTELFADGPHVATRAFEVGDPELGLEVANGLDLVWRRTAGRVTGSFDLFYDRFDDFVFESLTVETEDGLTVIRFRQADADFYGAEAEAAIDLYHRSRGHLVLELSGDVVRAELRESGEALPRIPPLRLGAGLDFHHGPWRAFGEVRWADAQDRIAPEETPTDGYTLVNASVSRRWLLGGTILDVILRGRNLTDEEARQHTSFLKEHVPLPGRDVSLGLGLHF